MVDGKKRKGAISEEDMALVLQRYSAKTILGLLQEIAQFKFNDAKIDWGEIANKQAIGITCPRECQMLWRHLAYRHPLLEKLEEVATPLDDDSDLEFVMEPSPTVSGEISTEAFAYVKVLMSSGLNNDSSPTNHPPVEAPLTINIPDMQLPLQKEDMHMPTQGQNIRVPVFVQKHALPAVLPVENLDGNGTSCSNQPARKKRKGWNKGDEKKLLEAIQKHGIGNWQDLEKEDFRVPRTASEIHQKWIHMKTKNTGTAINYKRTTLSEDQLSMRQALSMALDSPSNRSSSAPCSGGTTSSISSSIFSTAIPETASFNLQKVPNQSQQTLSQAIPHKIGSSLLNKPRTGQVRAPITITQRTGSNTMIQKAAIAAGGRIAPAETAASLFKAVQSKNVFHIRPGVTVSVSAAPTKPSPSTLAVGPHPSVTSQTLSSPPVSSGTVSSVSGAGNQISKCSAAKPTIQLATQPFSTLLQHPCKQPQEKPKQTVCVPGNTVGNMDGTACSLPKGGAAAPKTVASASIANEGQLSVVDLETDEVDDFADGVDKGNGTMKDTQNSSEMLGNACKSSSPVFGHDKDLLTKTCEMRQISLQNLSQCTVSQEGKKSKHSAAVDGYPSLDDGKGKAIVSLEKEPNEGLSQASPIQDSVVGQDKNTNSTSCVSTSAEVETSKVPVMEDDGNTENGGHCLGNVTQESITPAGTTNDSQRKDGMVCTVSSNVENASAL